MSDFDSLRDDVGRMAESFACYVVAVDRYTTTATEQIDRLWSEQAELRDEIHALANRIEANTGRERTAQ